jgi:capsular exopolysaccharide synthesis family protein
MSKYFDETLKLHNRDLTVALAFSDTSAAESLFRKTAPPRAAAALRLGSGPRTSIALAQTLRHQFTEHDALGTFQESYRVLRTRLLRLQSERGLRSVVVTSSTKSEGKSAVSLNLAFSCAQLPEMKVLVIDSDIRSCGLSRLLDAPKGPGLSSVLSQKSEPEEAILATDLPNLHFLPCDSSPIPPAELLAGRRWSELIASCAETFSLVIVDAPPVLNLTDVDLIAAPCDGVLMVVRAQQTRTDLLQKATSQVDSRKLIGVILNGADEDRDTYTYGNASATARPILRPVSIVSRLFGRDGSEKHHNSLSAEPTPSQPAPPSLQPEAAQSTTPSSNDDASNKQGS